MSKKFTSTIAGASIFIASFGFISKGIGFLREVLFASLFGLSTSFDIYLIGAVLPLTINVIIICLGQNYLIPAYNKFKERDDKLSENFIYGNFFIFIGGGILLSGLLYLFSDLIITSYLQNSDDNLRITAINVFNLFLITIPITCAISVITAYQQSNFEFKYPVIAQLICNIIILFAVYILKDINIYAIPVGYVFGSVVQLIFLLAKSNKLFSKVDGVISSLRWYKDSASGILIIILIESIGQLYLISDRYFFSSVSRGGISSLNYGMTVFMLPMSIISIALSTAIFPKFSQLFSKKLNSELERTLNDGIIIIMVIFTPIMFLFLLYGDSIIKIIFERGKFSGADTIITSEVLFFYSLSIVFYASYGILNKIIYSTGLIDKLLYITIGGIVIKILLNFLLVGSMEQNGLALSTSMSFIFFFIASFKLVYKKLAFMNKSVFFTEFILNLINGLIAAVLIYQISFLLPDNSFFSFIKLILFLLIFILNLILLKSSSVQILIRPFN